MKRIVLLAGALGLAVALAAGYLLVSASSAEACPDYTGYHAFIDKGHDTYFAFTLDSMTKPTGSASFGIAGVGMVDISAPSFSVGDHHTLAIHSQGVATLETDAVIDLDLGLNQPGSNLQNVTIRFDGTVALDDGTAKVHLWLGSKDYTVEGGRPDKSPDHALAALTSAISQRDWVAVYDMTAPLWAQLTTRTDFVSQMTAGWQSHFGTAKPKVRLTSAPQLADSGLGYWTASVRLSIEAGSASGAFNVTMQYVGDRWLVLDLRPA